MHTLLGYTYTLLLGVSFLTTPSKLYGAEEFITLTDLPSSFANTSDPGAFLNALFQYGIIIAGFLAVFMLVWAGFEYMTTEAITGKSAAKQRIIDTFAGLFLILLSGILLSLINPDILDFSLFD